jgi:hypothetical protein
MEVTTNGVIGYARELIGADQIPYRLYKGFDNGGLRELFGI